MYYSPIIGSGMTLEKVFGGLTPSNLRVFDYTKLVTNSTNRFGIVNGSNVVTQSNSVSPGTIGYNLPVDGTGPTLSAAGAFFTTDAVVGRFLESTASNLLDFTYVGTSSTVKWTMFIVADIADNNAFGSILGNSDYNVTLGGLTINTDTGSSQTKLQVRINDTSGVTEVCFSEQDGVITIGTMCIYCIEVDLSQAAASRVKMWRGNTAFTPNSSGSNTPLASPVSRKWAIGSSGEAAAGNVDFCGTIKLIAVHNGLITNRQQVMQRISEYTRVAL